MKRYLCAFVFVLVALVPLTFAQTPSMTIAVDGATLTLTPTANQVTALQAVVAAYNATERNGMPPFTVNEWIRAILITRVQSAVEAFRATNARAACDAFDKLTAADQKVVTDKLGGKAPCVN